MGTPNEPLAPAEKAAAEAILRHFGRSASCEDCHLLVHDIAAAVRGPIEESYARTVTKLATALDNLGGRIYRDIDPENTSLPTDSESAAILDRFMSFAENSLAVLNDPEVRSVVDAALSRPTAEKH